MKNIFCTLMIVTTVAFAANRDGTFLHQWNWTAQACAADPTRSLALLSDAFEAYAAPNTWGPVVPLTAHLGPATYSVAYRAVGKTLVVGEIEYTNESGSVVTQEFRGEISFRTGNFVAQPKVRFKGVPFGSAVSVTVK